MSKRGSSRDFPSCPSISLPADSMSKVLPPSGGVSSQPAREATRSKILDFQVVPLAVEQHWKRFCCLRRAQPCEPNPRLCATHNHVRTTHVAQRGKSVFVVPARWIRLDSVDWIHSSFSSNRHPYTKESYSQDKGKQVNLRKMTLLQSCSSI